MLCKEFLLTNKESLIKFSIRSVYNKTLTSVPYEVPKGMTWSEFLDSKYYYVPNGSVNRIESVKVISAGISSYQIEVNGARIETSGGSGGFVYASDVIEPDGDYPAYTLICVVKNTLITLADGSSKQVENIAYEDELLVWDFDKGCFATAKPLWIKKAQKSSYYYRLKFDDGSEIGLVGQDGKCHRLFNVEKQEFISGTDFHVGEHTFNVEGKQLKLMSIEIVDDEVEYYNIITDYHMNCFANGLLTSTQYNNVYPIKDMKFVKDGRKMIPFKAYEGIPKKFYEGMRLGEQDLAIRSVEKTNAYIGRMIRLMR